MSDDAEKQRLREEIAQENFEKTYELDSDEVGRRLHAAEAGVPCTPACVPPLSHDVGCAAAAAAMFTSAENVRGR